MLPPELANRCHLASIGDPRLPLLCVSNTSAKLLTTRLVSSSVRTQEVKRIHAAVVFDTPPFPEAFGGEALIRAVHAGFKDKFEKDAAFPAKMRMYIGTAAVSVNYPGLAARISSSRVSSCAVYNAYNAYTWRDLVHKLQQLTPHGCWHACLCCRRITPTTRLWPTWKR